MNSRGNPSNFLFLTFFSTCPLVDKAISSLCFEKQQWKIDVATLPSRAPRRAGICLPSQFSCYFQVNVGIRVYLYTNITDRDLLTVGLYFFQTFKNACLYSKFSLYWPCIYNRNIKISIINSVNLQRTKAQITNIILFYCIQSMQRDFCLK